MSTRGVDESSLSKTRVSDSWAQNTRVFELQWDYMRIFLPKKHNKSNISECFQTNDLDLVVAIFLST